MMDADRKAKLGGRWGCFSCGVKFYDLGKPEPICPRCQADQRQSPKFEQPKAKRSRATKKTPARPAPAPRPALVAEPEADSEIDFEEVELIGAEGMGLDSSDEDEPGAEAAEEVEID